MGDRDRQQPHQLQVHPQQLQSRLDQMKSQGPSKSKMLAVLAMLPVGGTLLFLAGITLVASLIGLALATPVFILFSPVIVPAALTIGLAVVGFLTSGTFGLTGLTSLSYLLNSFRQAAGSMPEQLQQAKHRMQDLAAYTGQKTKEVGQTIQQKAQEVGQQGGQEGGARREGART